MSDDKYHGFGDIIESQKGIFGNDQTPITGDSAMAAHSRAPGVAKPDGIGFTSFCEGCGSRMELTVEWPEAIAVKNLISPHLAYQGQNIVSRPTPWGFNRERQTWSPDIRCGSCSWQFPLEVAPQEFDRFIREGIGKGWLNEQAYQQLSQLCMAMKQRYQGR